MPRLIACLLIFVVILTACQAQGSSDSRPIPGDGDPVAMSLSSEQAREQSSAANAVYFVAAEGGDIDPADLQQHPELAVVHTFDDLKAVAGEKEAIWVDKNVAGQVAHAWLREPSQLTKTIVVVGYHDSLYAFREALGAFGIKGPYVDWSQKRISPGFSVWKLKTYTATERSAWMRGYEQPSTIGQIVTTTAPLQEAEAYIEQADR